LDSFNWDSNNKIEDGGIEMYLNIDEKSELEELWALWACSALWRCF